MEENQHLEDSSEDITKLLKDLKAGESIEIGDTLYINPKRNMPCKVHHFEFDGISGEYHAYKCVCGAGRIIDPKVYEVIDGKIKHK